jgi:hypothetical protein
VRAVPIRRVLRLELLDRSSPLHLRDDGDDLCHGPCKDGYIRDSLVRDKVSGLNPQRF